MDPHIWPAPFGGGRSSLPERRSSSANASEPWFYVHGKGPFGDCSASGDGQGAQPPVRVARRSGGRLASTTVGENRGTVRGRIRTSPASRGGRPGSSPLDQGARGSSLAPLVLTPKACRALINQDVDLSIARQCRVVRVAGSCANHQPEPHLRWGACLLPSIVAESDAAGEIADFKLVEWFGPYRFSCVEVKPTSRVCIEHYLHSDGGETRESGGNQGRVRQQGARLAVVEHNERPELRRRIGGAIAILCGRRWTAKWAGPACPQKHHGCSRPQGTWRKCNGGSIRSCPSRRRPNRVHSGIVGGPAPASCRVAQRCNNHLGSSMTPRLEVPRASKHGFAAGEKCCTLVLVSNPFEGDCWGIM